MSENIKQDWTGGNAPRHFGTYYLPGKQWPSGYGVGGHPVPSGFVRQFLYPFHR